MLTFTKTAIYEHAHTYGVPYFKDSTPKWSTRGKLRNNLQPMLRDVYGEGIGAHLTSLAKDSAQCAALVEAQLLAPFWRRVGRSPAACWVDCAEYASMPVFFWREALRHVCEQMLGCGLVRERPIRLLMERLQKPSKARKDGWFALKRENKCFMVGTTLVIFSSHVFPGHHDGRVWVPAAHAEEGTRIDLDGGKWTTLGAWRVRVSHHTNSAPARPSRSSSASMSAVTAASSSSD